MSWVHGFTYSCFDAEFESWAQKTPIFQVNTPRLSLTMFNGHQQRLDLLGGLLPFLGTFQVEFQFHR